MDKYIVDLGAYPFIPDGYELKTHVKGGLFEWDAQKVTLYRSF